MPSSFDDQFEQLATPHLVDQFGEDVIYLVGGAETTLTGVVLDERVLEETRERGRQSESMLQVEIGRDPASERGGIANPRLDAQMRVRNVLYAVKEIVEQSAYSTTLGLVRSEAIEVSRPKYRG